jgi:hypothetical protein
MKKHARLMPRYKNPVDRAEPWENYGKYEREEPIEKADVDCEEVNPEAEQPHYWHADYCESGEKRFHRATPTQGRMISTRARNGKLAIPDLKISIFVGKNKK